MQSRLSGHETNPHAAKKNAKVVKTLAAIAAVLVGLCLVLVVGFNQMYRQMTPHEQGLSKAWGEDFVHGRWDFKGTRQTAERNAQESKQKLEQANKEVEEAQHKYEQALAEQKRVVAEAKKRKAKKAYSAKKASEQPSAERDGPKGIE